MPELPEVETIRRYLADVITAKMIIKVDILLARQIKWPQPEGFRSMAIGHSIEAVKRRGKYLLLELDNNNKLIFHLRMTGRLVYAPDGNNNDTYARVILHFADGSALVYGDTRTLGAIYALKNDEIWRIHALNAMGPEPLTADFSADYLYNTAQKRKTAIKSFLLNQEIIGGIGNIYADEALFLAKIFPKRPANSLTKKECEQLYQAVNEVIAAGIRDGGTSFRDYKNGEGKKGAHQNKLLVYGRTGKPCTSCQTPIVKITVGGRGTHYCPRCQAEITKNGD